MLSSLKYSTHGFKHVELNHPQALRISAHTKPTARGRHQLQVLAKERVPSAGPSTALRLFIDSADKVEWSKWLPTGMFYGITTNPAILERDGVHCTLPALSALSSDAFALGATEMQLQAWGGSTDALFECGLQLAEMDDRIVVKVPITREGIEAGNRLLREGVGVTMTAVYTTHQAFSAAALGATYAAPYLGRMNDNGRAGIDNIIDMQRIVEASDSDMRVLVASIRQASELAELAAEGLDTFTFSPAVAAQLFNDSLTINAAAEFEAAAVRMQ